MKTDWTSVGLLLCLLSSQSLALLTSICLDSTPTSCLLENGEVEPSYASVDSFPIEVQIMDENSSCLIFDTGFNFESCDGNGVSSVYLDLDEDELDVEDDVYMVTNEVGACLTLVLDGTTVSTAVCNQTSAQLFYIPGFYENFLESVPSSVPAQSPTRDPVGPYQPFGDRFKRWYTSILLLFPLGVVYTFAKKFGSTPAYVQDNMDYAKSWFGLKGQRDKNILEAIRKENNISI